MSSVMDLFYTDTCILMTATTSLPNMYGVCEQTHEILFPNEIPCCLTPISTSLAREKYGLDSSTSFEISMDLIDGLDVKDVSAILYDDEVYIVQSYQQFSEFLILPKSVTFLVKKQRDN